MKSSIIISLTALIVGTLGQSVEARQQAPSPGWKFGGFAQMWVLGQNTGVVPDHPGIPEETWGVRLRRIRFSARNDFNSTYSFYALTDFAERDRNLLDAAIVARFTPQIVVTAGQFTAPGQMYETSSVPSSKLTFYEISDIAAALSNTMGYQGYRDVGIMISGTWNMFRYAAYAGNGTGRLTYAGTGILNRSPGQGLVGARLDIQPIPGLLLGGHYSINSQDSINTGTAASPSAVSYRRSSFSFNGLIDGLPSLPGLVVDAEYGNGTMDDGSGIRYDGWFITAAYNILDDLQTAVRFDTYAERKPANAAQVTRANNVTLGFTRFIFLEKQELMRLGFNVEWRRETPTELRNDLAIFWLQIRF